MHFQNPKNKQLVCLTLSFLGFVFGWKAMGDTPWEAANVTLGIAVGILTYFVALTIADGRLSPLNVPKNMERIGLLNKAGESPLLLANRPEKKIKNGMILTFNNRGIERKIWEDKKEALEAVFNICIWKIKEGRNHHTIMVFAVPSNGGLPEMLPWTQDCLSHDDFVLVLGRAIQGVFSVNLATIPHILIGGSTGSGKSVLIKSLLIQCIQTGASVYVADFKGGVDYPQGWDDVCHMIFDVPTLLSTLKELVEELETRKEELRYSGCRNIHQYNTEIRDAFRRIIFGCDEVAELLDPTGRSKADKEQIDTIRGYLATLARQGRAMGIHLLLATQRPDAKVMDGQIKNNIDCRICGRADLVLSQIILDNGSAAEIPKDVPGRFICNLDGGIEFQGYAISDFGGGRA